MDLGKNLENLVFAPVRVGLAATEAGMGLAGGARDLARRALYDVGEQTRPVVVHVLGLDETVARANHLAKFADTLLDDEAPLGRALAPDGPLDRLLRPGGPADRLTAPDGLLDRLTAEGGVVDQLLDENGLVERLLAEDGVAERLLAEGGLVETLTARNGPLEQLADVADTLNRVTPGLEALAPTIETLREAAITLSAMVNPLSNIADLIPRPGRGRGRRHAPEPASAQWVVEHED